jgi:hypothetical protein
MRQTGGVVYRLHKQIARCTFLEEGSVEKSLSYQAKREVLYQMAPQYCQASAPQKWTLLRLASTQSPSAAQRTLPESIVWLSKDFFTSRFLPARRPSRTRPCQIMAGDG